MAGNRWASLGISVVVNGAILAAMARVLAGPPVPAETMITVQLESPVPVRVSRVEPPRHKTASPAPTRVQSPEKKARPVPVRETTRHSILPTPRLPSLFRPAEPKAAARGADRPKTDPIPFRAGSRPGDSGTAPDGIAGTRSAGGSQAEGTSAGGGTSARGPGAPSASGTGNGGSTRSGSGGGDQSVVSVANNRQEIRKSEPPAPKPVPPTPAPKGETRGAQATKQPRPPYPRDARDDGVEGTVVILATVSADGRVTETRIEKGSGDRRLDKAADRGVRQWVYRPALRNGVPVKATIRVHVEFRLE